MKQLTINISVFLGSLLFLYFTSQIVAAFTSPSLAPPDGNVAPPLQQGINPNVLDITGTLTGERDIQNINALMGSDAGASDLFVKSNPTETGPVYYGANVHRFYTVGTERLIILANGNVGIGESLPSGKLEIREDGVLTATDGNVVIQHPTSASFSSIVFPSRVNVGNDYGYIAYYDDSDTQSLPYNYWGNTAENSALIIGTQNDPLNAWSDVVVLKPSSATIIDSTLLAGINPGQAVGISQKLVGAPSSAKLVVNNPETASKWGSSGDAIYAYANNTNSAISAEQANALGWAGFFSGNVNITGSLTAGSGVDPSSTNEIQNVILNKGLQRDLSNNFGIQNCATDQIMKYNSLGEWICAADNSGAGGTITGGGTINKIAKFTPIGTAIGDSQIFDDGTNVGIGTASPDSALEVVESGSDLAVFLTEYRSVMTSGAGLFFRKARGTEAAPTTVLSGDQVGRIRFTGYDGTSFLDQVAQIEAQTEGTVGTNQMPGVLIISTYNNANPSVSTERLRINSSGNVGIGTASPAFTLDVNGTARVTGKLTVTTIDPVYEIDGKKYATYVADFAGGVRTETAGTINVSCQLSVVSCRHVIDFDEQERGSDLWLFWKTIVQDMKDVAVILTPGFDGKAWYEKDADKNQIIIYSDNDGEISYRLTAPREDAAQWPNEITE